MFVVPTVLTALAIAGAVTPTPQNARPSVAVLRFADRGSFGLAPDDRDALPVGLQEMLITELQLNSFLQLVDRERLGAFAFDRLDASGEPDVVAASQLGAQAGAAYVIIGGFADLHGDFRIDLKVVNVGSGTVVRTERLLQHRDSIYSMIVDLAGNVTQSLNVPGLSRQALAERRSRVIPADAVRLYTRGLLYRDRGEVERARDALQQAKQIFPDYREVDVVLRRLGR